MTDMGPRRSMDMRPARPAQAPQPQAQPQPRPAQPRPVQPRPQPAAPVARPAAARPVQQQRQAAPQAQAPAPVRENRGGGGWKVVLQIVIGLLVIVGVAAAIVALYVKYYQ